MFSILDPQPGRQSGNFLRFIGILPLYVVDTLARALFKKSVCITAGAIACTTRRLASKLILYRLCRHLSGQLFPNPSNTYIANPIQKPKH